MEMQGEMYVLNRATAFIGGFCPPCEFTNTFGWTNDGGVTWNISEHEFMGYSPLKISFLDEKQGWVVTSGGDVQPKLYKTNDCGISWNEVYDFSHLVIE